MAATGSNIGDPVAAHVPGDDRMWIDAFDDAKTVAMNYHDLASGLIHVQLSNDGGAFYNAGNGEAISDADTIGAANGTGSGNIAGQIKFDHNTNGCSSRGNLYQIFSAPIPRRKIRLVRASRNCRASLCEPFTWASQKTRFCWARPRLRSPLRTTRSTPVRLVHPAGSSHRSGFPGARHG